MEKEKIKRIIFKEQSNYNPLKKIVRKDLEGWQVGQITVLSKEPSNRLRNLVCESLQIKQLVFGRNNKKSK